MDCLSTIPTKFDMLFIFIQTEQPLRVDALALVWYYRQKVSFPKTQQTNAKFRNRTESRQHTTVAHLRFYILSCNGVGWGDSVKRLSQGRNWRYAQCEHRASYLTITIRR